MWPMGLLFLNTSQVKQYSYEDDFSGVVDALHQSFLVLYCIRLQNIHISKAKNLNVFFRFPDPK